MKAVFQRLGMPIDPKDYDFPSLKNEKGEVTDTALEATLRTASEDAMLSKEAAAKVSAAITKHLADAGKTKSAADTAALAEEKGKLLENWGPKHAQNMVVAQNAAAALGVQQADIEALEKAVGYSRVMEMFRAIGSKIGEDKFITNDGPGGKISIATKEQAQARITELKSDKAWTTRYLEGGVAEQREMSDLTKIVVGSSVEGVS